MWTFNLKKRANGSETCGGLKKKQMVENCVDIF